MFRKCGRGQSDELLPLVNCLATQTLGPCRPTPRYVLNLRPYRGCGVVGYANGTSWWEGRGGCWERRGTLGMFSKSVFYRRPGGRLTCIGGNSGALIIHCILCAEPLGMFRNLWQGSVWDGIGWEAKGKPKGTGERRRAQVEPTGMFRKL